ncbi:MAG: hypothetical protein AB7F23_04220 [Phycisphaerae bacterium]
MTESSNHRLADWIGAGLIVLLFSLIPVAGFAAEYDSSYSPLFNGTADHALQGWVCENTSILDENQERSFKLAFGGDSASMTSDMFSIRKGEQLRLRFKANASVKASLIFYSSSKDLLSTADAQPSVKDGEFFAELKADSEALYAAVAFSTDNSVILDDIFVDREISYRPLYEPVRPLARGDKLYVYKTGRRPRDNDVIAVQTLQGVVARTSGPKIWIDTGDMTFADGMKDKFDIQFDYTYAEDAPGLLKELIGCTSGKYVLYDLADLPSISAATTMAGLLDGIAIDRRIENTAKAAGYELGIDVRGKDCKWVYENYRDELSYDSIIVHTNNKRHHSSAPRLRDIGPAKKSIDWWLADEAYSRSVYSSMNPVSPVYGWQDPITPDEGLTVKIHSEEGLFQVPSDFMYNLTTHFGFSKLYEGKSFKPKTVLNKPKTEQGVHYVTFIMSDMDNILTEIGDNSFYSNQRFYDNPHRGEFPMSWGMAPSLVEMSPLGIDMWYEKGKSNEAFVGYCGLGYFYPDCAPYMQTHARRLESFINRSGLHTMLLIDRLLPDKPLDESYAETAKWFMQMEQLRGLFYMEYIEYAPHGGKIYWFNGKPMVTARFDFRSEEFYGAVRSTPQKLADSINALPKDPSNPDSYTFVTVHAWSKGMDGIAETIKLLDDNVRVVHADDFIEIITHNLAPAAK